ncbi:MAG: D-Ala-D-Ala carboxypeptidase family metallohydrolase [Verrucomicrobiota bacterium]
MSAKQLQFTAIQPQTRLPRRSFLATSLGTTGALALGTQGSQGFFFFGGKSNLDTEDLPKEWVRIQGGHLHSYARYIASLRLKHLSVQDVIRAHARRKGSVWNEIPPRAMWKSMRPTLEAADQVADVLGVGLKEVTSAYRSPAYNARCPGAKPRSYHKQNLALDLMFHASPSRVARVAKELRNNGLFSGGVGRYSSFTHIDTRGFNADW